MLAGIGIAPLIAESFHPFRSIHAQKAREFARRFWPEVARDGVPICLRWDLGMPEWDSVNLNVAVYLCNQMIYSPHRRHPGGRGLPDVDGGRPWRCVASLCEPDDPRVAAWLQAMRQTHHMKASRTVVVDMQESARRSRPERYVVYDFEAKPAPR